MPVHMRSDNDATRADRGFITRVAIKNYKSIAACDVRPASLSFLVGPNGSGKSNFLGLQDFGWENGSRGDAGGIKIEAAEVKVDGVAESLAVAEPAR